MAFDTSSSNIDSETELIEAKIEKKKAKIKTEKWNKWKKGTNRIRNVSNCYVSSGVLWRKEM